MKNFFQNLKFIIGIVLWFLIITAMFLGGYGMASETINLSTAHSKVGVIKSVSPAKGSSLNAFFGYKDIVVYLDSSKNGFWIYRASHNYKDISSRLIKGTKVKIYYSDLDDAGDYYTAYQIQTDNSIVYSKNEYERKEQFAGKFIALPAAVIMFAILIYQSYKKFFKSPPKPANPIE